MGTKAPRELCQKILHRTVSVRVTVCLIPAVLLIFQMLLPREPGIFVRHFRQVIPSMGCRKQQPNWAGLSALDPEQGTSVSAPLRSALNARPPDEQRPAPRQGFAVLDPRRKFHPRHL